MKKWGVSPFFSIRGDILSRKNFLFFHGFFATAILLNVITGFLMIRNMFFIAFISLSLIHRLSGGLLLLTTLFLFTTKKGRSALNIISTMTKPNIIDLKRRNILLFAFKFLNLIFVTAVIVQLATGIILIFNLFGTQSIYTLHYNLALPIIAIILSHIFMAILFNIKKKSHAKVNLRNF